MANKKQKIDPELERIKVLPREDLESMTRQLISTTRQQKAELSKLRNLADLGNLSDKEAIESITDLASYVLDHATEVWVSFSSRDEKWRLYISGSDGNISEALITDTLTSMLGHWVDQAQNKAEYRQLEADRVKDMLSKATRPGKKS